MDGGNGWHVIGGAAAGAQACDRAGAQDKTIINRTLHRFRPIAPKPVTGNDLDSSSSVFDIKKMLASKTFRTKRKYVRVRKSNKLKKNKRVSGVPSSDQEGEGEGGDLSSSVTLQLLPEGSESKDGESQERIGKSWYSNDNFQDLAADNMKEYVDDQENQEHPMCFQKRETTVAESWVTVECVTDIYSTCMDERAVLLGCTDVERMRNLEGGHVSRIHIGRFESRTVDERGLQEDAAGLGYRIRGRKRSVQRQLFLVMFGEWILEGLHGDWMLILRSVWAVDEDYRSQIDK
ncbi:VON WILLEBRAND FACTOR A DOMAIN PROTEIN [Salix purpurea]|uniref:VON WILLEBRAND FACTOR A DOMAIN PROTEIN n=1 Tax=Salix purpurea TaxID=77065 RepID=A0A9Q1A1G4_SALPP|nr:VON WILLEBRAND FACTOR A DOMAIN PROTEIN [Salix purpurea]